MYQFDLRINTLVKLIIILFLPVQLFAQLSLDELRDQPVFDKKSFALQVTDYVYRLRLLDYAPKKDVALIGKFVNCQELSFVASSMVDALPTDIKKLVNLQFLDLSETKVTEISSLIAANKLLKVVYVPTTLLDTDRKSLIQKGIQVVDSKVKYQDAFKVSTNTSVNEPLQSNVVVSNEKTEKPIETKTPAEQAKPVQPKVETAKVQLAQKDAKGAWFSNKDNVKVEIGKTWSINRNGETIRYGKVPAGGLMNGNGDVVAILPSYVSISTEVAFTEGLIPYKNVNTQKMGYLDTLGNLVIDAKFDDARSFKNGKALVKMGNQFAYIQRDGKVVFTGDFEEFVPFYHPNYAVIKMKGDDYYSILSSDGTLVSRNKFGKKNVEFPGEITAREMFDVGLIRCVENERYGFKNLKGDWVIKPIYMYASFFTGGVATVSFNIMEKLREDGFLRELAQSVYTKYGVINTAGKYILPLDFTSMSDPWHNHYEDEVTLAGIHSNKAAAVYDVYGKTIFGPIKQYRNQSIIRIEPLKNDHFLIEYSADKKITTRHKSDGLSSYCDFLTRDGVVVVEKNEYICFSMNEFGYFGLINYDPSVLISFGEKGSEVSKSPKQSGVKHIDGKFLFFQDRGQLSKDDSNYEFYNFRTNPKDPHKERNWSNYYKNFKETDKVISGKGESPEYEQRLVGKYSKSGVDVTNFNKKPGFMRVKFVTGNPRNGEDIFRFNHADAAKNFIGTGFYSISQDKILYMNSDKKKIGLFGENRFYVPFLGYSVERVTS